MCTEQGQLLKFSLYRPGRGFSRNPSPRKELYVAGIKKRPTPAPEFASMQRTRGFEPRPRESRGLSTACGSPVRMRLLFDPQPVPLSEQQSAPFALTMRQVQSSKHNEWWLSETTGTDVAQSHRHAR